MTCVYCNRCGAILIADDALRTARDHEMDEHPDGWGVTVYERIDA